MTGNVNKKIIDKIKSDNIDQRMKDFLIDIIRLEFRHSEDSKWKYSKEYERLIKQHLVDFGVEE